MKIQICVLLSSFVKHFFLEPQPWMNPKITYKVGLFMIEYKLKPKSSFYLPHVQGD